MSAIADKESEQAALYEIGKTSHIRPERVLITFSGSRYHLSTKKIVEDGPRYGATKVLVYDDVWLKTQKEHCAATKWAFDDPKVRGVNWFCFKPYTIIKALECCQDGDIVLFTDSDCWPIADMTPLFEMCERESIVLFAACSHQQYQWSKRDTQIVMGMDSFFWRNKQAGVARFMLFKKNGVTDTLGIHSVWSETFLKEWLRYSSDIRANTFDKSVLAEEYADGFIQARCEQAILTNLAHRFNLPLHREADQWGNGFEKDFPNDTYPQIFESTGVYSYDPNPNHGPGSSFRNVNE